MARTLLLKNLLGLLVSLLLAGCGTIFGAGTVEEAKLGYNEAITRSEDEQLLLNLVRLRYRDSANFLKLSSVVTQYSYESSLGTSFAAPIRMIRTATGGLSGSMSYEERPTIAYEPLQGTEFAQRMLAPISAETIVLLSQSGWSIERLLLCCVERVNGLSNASSASGPTPKTFPDNGEFRRLATLLRNLQIGEVLSAHMQTRPDTTAAPIVALDIERARKKGLLNDVAEVKGTLGLSPASSTFPIVAGAGSQRSERLSVKGRSLLGVLYTLSHAVEVPPEDVQAGLAVMSARAQTAGTPSWRQDFLAGTFGVSVYESEPSQSFVKVKYRDNWYAIPDTDLEAKTTFSLLKFLTAIQSAAGEGATPLLTLSAGG